MKLKTVFIIVAVAGLGSAFVFGRKAHAEVASYPGYAPDGDPGEHDDAGAFATPPDGWEAPPNEELHGESHDHHGGRRRRPVQLSLHGYGDIGFAFYDHGANQNRASGSQRDKRLTFDTTRFVLALEGKLPAGFEFEAEVEFEHNGVGAAVEVGYEEFGEIETEVSQGGEIKLEELLVAREFGDFAKVEVGRLYVAVGNLSKRYKPIDYLATTRSEAETMLLPAVWSEIGVSGEAKFGPVETTLQIVNGLDSTGFSSQRWIALGHQQRFEVTRATDLAVVVRVDVEPKEGISFGGSIYYGGTSKNRPTADLVKDCSKSSENQVAPCGYVSAPVTIVDAHGALKIGRFRGSALLLWGHLANADAVSARNERLSNELGVLRTPIANEALAASLELGVNVLPQCLCHAHLRLEPFARVEYYDTMFGVRDGLFDNPRFERTLVTAGVSFTHSESLFAKFDISHRRMGSDAIRNENTVRISTGFVF